MANRVKGALKGKTSNPLRNEKMTDIEIAAHYKKLIETNMERFCVGYIQKSKTEAVPEGESLRFELTENLQEHMDNIEKGKAVATITIGIDMILGGLRTKIFAKAINVTHVRHLKDETKMRIMLYGELIYELIGAGLSLAVMMEKHKETQALEQGV